MGEGHPEELRTSHLPQRQVGGGYGRREEREPSRRVVEDVCLGAGFGKEDGGDGGDDE